MSEYTVGGIGISAVAEEFGTPCYVYDGERIRRDHDSFRGRLDDSIRLFYSLKPNPNVSIVKLLLGLGTGVEVCSMGELTTAIHAGAQPQDILFTGPGKSVEELTTLVQLGVRAIICESFEELQIINDLADKPVPVLLRVNPAFGVQGGRLTMAGKPRQFGIDEDQVLNAKLRHPKIRLLGIHCYTGTRILNADVIVENTWRVFDLAGKVAEALNFTPELVDIGGGIGLAYYPGETDPDEATMTNGINKAVAAFHDRFPGTQIAMEPGRYLVGRAGVFVVKARYVKHSRGERFVVTDGGTHQNMSAVGTGTYLKRNFPMRLLSDVDRPVQGPCHVTGPLLTPTDLLGKDVELPSVEPGDLIGVLRCGAYGPTASIAYMNGQGYPAEVLVHNGKALLVRRRDTPEDLLSRQIVVDL